MSRYSKDPYWITARYNGTCKKCGEPIRKGDRIFYWPSSKSANCTAHGESEARVFEMERWDEDVYAAGHGV